jgi:hypothetical protein
MLKGGSRFPVAMADVFPHGCHLVPDSISEAIDYDEETKRRSPAADKLTERVLPRSGDRRAADCLG